jgi:hypothetical protein
MRRVQLNALMCFLWIIGSGTYGAAQTQQNRDSLKGLNGFLVIVDGNRDPDAAQHGASLTDIQLATELTLRKTGISVVDKSEWLKTADSRFPLLHVTVELIKGDGELKGLFAFHMSVQVEQNVFLNTPNNERIEVVSWQTGRLGVVGKDHLNDLRSIAATLIDRFLNEYLAANPPNKS